MQVFPDESAAAFAQWFGVNGSLMAFMSVIKHLE
jgi:hypothetical protein